MRRILVMVGVVIAGASLFLGEANVRGTASSGSAEQVVRRLHNELVQAQLKGDAVALDRIWADDHTFTNPLGVVQTKAERLGEIKSGDRRLEFFSVADVQVRVYGNTAVVTSHATLKGQRQGHDFSGQYRGIDVYVNNRGQWQVVAAQATRIVQP
jgi:ketosteroid isomerase-like protein